MTSDTHPAVTALLLNSLNYEQIAFEFARNHCGPRNPAEILIMDCGINAQQFAALADDPMFQKLVRTYVKELTENGASFQLKARLQAEELLKTNYKLATHKDTPPSVAEKLIANTVRWAGLEKKAEGGEAGLGGPKISINIDLGNNTPPQNVVIDVPAVPTTTGE